MATKEAGFVNLSVKPSSREKLRTLHKTYADAVPMWELLDRIIDEALQRQAEQPQRL